MAKRNSFFGKVLEAFVKSKLDNKAKSPSRPTQQSEPVASQSEIDDTKAWIDAIKAWLKENPVDMNLVKEGGSFTIRDDALVKTDQAFDAWTSGDLSNMLAALETKTHPIDRHYLLMGIVDETYKKRRDPEMRKALKKVAEIHIREFETIAPHLMGFMEPGVIPHTSTFQKYATVLTEDKEYDKAIEVCRIAISCKLHDLTRSGFEGRIARINKRKEEAERYKTNIV